MKHKSKRAIAMLSAALAASGSTAIHAQDKYALKSPRMIRESSAVVDDRYGA